MDREKVYQNSSMRLVSEGLGWYIDQTSFWQEKENSYLNIATTGLGWLEQIFVKTLPFSNEQIIGYDDARNAFKVKTISE